MADAPGSQAPKRSRPELPTGLVQELAQFIADHPKLLVLSGAGLSTASGIGDYRDRNGDYKRPPPMTISEFMGGNSARQRYWARSLYGYPSFAAAGPNAGHEALANLTRHGYLQGGLITQNVDSLHQLAGHPDPIALHGRLVDVVCMSCGVRSSRQELQARMLEANSGWLSGDAQLLPDGDADLEDADFARFVVPSCSRCNGILKPDVVFFGDAVPRERLQACYELVDAAAGLLIVGSSVMVFSSFRFCRRAQAAKKPMAAVNLGKTRADEWYRFKHQQPCAEHLVAAAKHLGCSA